MEKYRAIFFILSGLSVILGGLVFIAILSFYDNIHRGYYYVFMITCITGGLIFLYFGISSYIGTKDMSIQPDKGVKLKQTGKKTIAQIMNVIHITNIRVNMRAPYVILAKGVNPVTNQQQIFKSYYIWQDILFLIKNKQTVDVYIDPNDPKKYYMDVETLLYEAGCD